MSRSVDEIFLLTTSRNSSCSFVSSTGVSIAPYEVGGPSSYAGVTQFCHMIRYRAQCVLQEPNLFCRISISS